jgi:uncharacterized membrane protein
MAETNSNARLEAFSDGVFAIALTLLILDIKIPPSVTVTTAAELWRALRELAPSVFAFLLSFGVILITWVNHHNALGQVDRASYPFMYANGFFLLTVVVFPFPTALLGAYLFTDMAAPAVILYCAACGLQSVGWNLLTRTALRPRLLARDERAALAIRTSLRYSYFAFVLYAACAFVALWYPQVIALIITFIWIVWLVIGLKMKAEERLGG